MGNRAENLSFGKYRLVAELGSGGMGDVFLAFVQGPRGFNKLQVIKRLRPELAEDDEFLGMFLNEARLAARLNHPNVVQTNEVGEADGTHFIAMEYLEGQSLHAVLRRAQGRFPLTMHLRVLAEVCAGLHHAHELLDFDGTPLAVVHRDCSPQNIFITYDGGVKVLDFGIAKATDSSSFTRTGVLKGKVPYMAPEQLEGHDVDRRADVFAVGSMLWEAAAGTRLWKGLNDVQIAHRVHLGDIPSPRTLNPDVAPQLEAICMRCLAMDRETRYPTAAALQHDLELLVDELGGATHRDVGKWVATAFVETRRQLRTRIEQELKQLLAGRAATSDVPLWRSGEAPAARSGEHSIAPGTPVGRDAPTLTNPVPIPPTSEPELRSNPIGVSSGQIAVAPRAGEEPTTQATLPAISSLPLSERTNPRTLFPNLEADAGRRRRALALLFGAVVVATVLVVLVIRGREPQLATGSTKEGSKEPTKSTSKGSAVLTLDVEPKDAKVFIDDKLAGADKVPIALGTAHVVRVEAEGYRPRTETVTLGEDGALKVVLSPLGAGVASATNAAQGTKSEPGSPGLGKPAPGNPNPQKPEPGYKPGDKPKPGKPVEPPPTITSAPVPTAAPTGSGAKPKPTLDREDPWQK